MSIEGGFVDGFDASWERVSADIDHAVAAVPEFPAPDADEYAELYRQNKALESANLELEQQMRETAKYASDLFNRVYALCDDPSGPAVPPSILRKALELP